jgi:phosphocarrier protein FPr
LKLIEMTVKAAHDNGKWVGVCGGLASDAKAIPILLGLGVDELSVSIPVIPLVKSQVRETRLTIAKDFAQRATSASSAVEVRGT